MAEEKKIQTSGETVGSMIAQAIRNGIASGKYLPGEKVKETELCKVFGVSRTPVREAFRMLQNDGTLIYTPQRGVHVAQFGPEEAGNLQQIRIALEMISVKNAAPFASEQDVQELRKINEQIRAFNPSNPQQTNHLDMEFHLKIARIGRNPYVAEFLSNILERYKVSGYMLAFKAERVPHTWREHEDILYALEHHDAVLAEKYMSIHFHFSTIAQEQKMQEYLEKHKKKYSK